MSTTAASAAAPSQGGVHVALHLHQREGRRRQRAVGAGDAVPRVLPALVGEPARVAASVVDEAVAVGVAGPMIQSTARPTAGARRAQRVLVDRPPPPGLCGEADEEGSGVDRAVIAAAGGERRRCLRAPQLVQDATGLLLGRRVVLARPGARRGWPARRRRGSRRTGSVIHAVSSESRPNSVMNHGAPAATTARSGCAPSTMRKAARSASAWSTAAGNRGSSDTTEGTDERQAVSSRIATPRASSEGRSRSAGTPAETGCTVTVTVASSRAATRRRQPAVPRAGSASSGGGCMITSVRSCGS